MKIPIWGQPPDQNCYDDSLYWEVRNPISHKYHSLTINHDSDTTIVVWYLVVLGVFNHTTRAVFVAAAA